MQAYSFHTPEDASRLQIYKVELQKIYARLSHIEDPAEHRKQLGEAIQHLKSELGMPPQSREGICAVLVVMMTTRTMYMTVRQLFFRRLTHFHDFHVEVKGLSSQGMVGVNRGKCI